VASSCCRAMRKDHDREDKDGDRKTRTAKLMAAVLTVDHSVKYVVNTTAAEICLP
jgi:hypothetical protein